MSPIRNPRCRRALLLVAVASLIAGTAFARPSNKWRIQVSESAKSDGVIVLHFQPVGEAVQVVEITVAKGLGENAVAGRIRDVLKEQLRSDRYHVEVDDGEDVLVKKNKGWANFDLRLASNSVESVRLNLDRE